MAVSMVCAKKDTHFGVDSRRSWVTAVFLSLTLAAVLIGQHSELAACGVHVGANVLVSQHFEKRRATACSIIYTSLGINSLYLPPLAEFLRVTYGIRGTFLLLGGLILHSLPPVLAVRSPEWAKPRRQSSGSAVTEPEMNAEVAPNNLFLPANGAQGCHNPDDHEVSHGNFHEGEFTELPHVQNQQFVHQRPSIAQPRPTHQEKRPM
ncbi:hypothetical protein MRX96_001956 [Rhipicephalus microplus]